MCKPKLHPNREVVAGFYRVDLPGPHNRQASREDVIQGDWPQTENADSWSETGCRPHQINLCELTRHTLDTAIGDCVKIPANDDVTVPVSYVIDNGSNLCLSVWRRKCVRLGMNTISR